MYVHGAVYAKQENQRSGNSAFPLLQGDENTEYVADFVIFNNDGTCRIVDVKGVETDVFKLKMKMFKARFPQLEVEIEKG